MAIVPHTHPPTHALDPTIAPPEPGFRWECRVYPGQLALISQVRTDMCTDLNRLVALPEEAREEMVLCASEMFANACDHSRSGHDPDGRVVRTLEAPVPGLVRVSIIDDGARTDTTVDSLPRVPRRRTRKDWEEAERGRGLLMVGHLASRWGFRPVLDFPFCEGLGTVIWAEFTLPALANGGVR